MRRHDPGGCHDAGGGHFWVTTQATGKSIEYVGDVRGEDLHQDDLKVVAIPGKPDGVGTPTGTVFNERGRGFEITQDAPGGPITAPAKFIFVTDEGVVSAWTERRNSTGKFDRPDKAILVADHSKEGSMYYAEQEEPGEEEQAEGKGRLAEFTVNGVLINTWDGGELLNAPWGVAAAPSDGFGPNSGKLLVSNFGDGTITVFDKAHRKAIGYVNDPDGKRIEIEGIWAVTFGNGVALGESNALYFAAGPEDEKDGIFGRLTWAGK